MDFTCRNTGHFQERGRVVRLIMGYYRKNACVYTHHISTYQLENIRLKMSSERLLSISVFNPCSACCRASVPS